MGTPRRFYSSKFKVLAVLIVLFGLINLAHVGWDKASAEGLQDFGGTTHGNESESGSEPVGGSGWSFGIKPAVSFSVFGSGSNSSGNYGDTYSLNAKDYIQDFEKGLQNGSTSFSESFRNSDHASSFRSWSFTDRSHPASSTSPSFERGSESSSPNTHGTRESESRSGNNSSSSNTQKNENEVGSSNNEPNNESMNNEPASTSAAPTNQSTGTSSNAASASESNTATSTAAATTESQGNGAMVSIDFDDGWQSAYDNGTPILESAGFKGTYFIITSAVGESNYMTWNEIDDLAADGNEIGDHTRDHPDFSSISDDEAKQEIDEGYNDLEDQEFTPQSFAYPYGHYDSTDEESVADEGMTTARAAGSGFKLNDTDTDPYGIWGQSLTNDMTWDEIKANIDTAVQEGKWYIIIIHSIDNDKQDPYNISSDLLQKIVDYLKENNVNVVTNSEGAAQLGL